MSLKVELKPNERILIGEAVITNCDQRSWLVIDGAELRSCARRTS